MIISEFKKSSFDELNSLTKANEQLASEKKLLEVGKIIRQYGYEKVVGLCLLHRHIDLSQNERLIEHLIDDCLVLEPKIIDASGDIIPFSWKFEYDSNFYTYSMVPLEFSSKKTPFVETICEVILHDVNFLKDIAKKLNELNLLNIIGLGSLHQIKILINSTNDTIEEFTEPNTRSHILKGVKYDNSHHDTAINTLWTYDLQSKKGCNKLCRRDEWHC